MLTVLPF